MQPFVYLSIVFWLNTALQCRSSMSSNLFKAFDSIHRGKIEQIFLAYGLPKETVAAKIMLDKNTKVKVRSPDGNSSFFDIIAVVLQGDTFAPCLFTICLDYLLRTPMDLMKNNSLHWKRQEADDIPHKLLRTQTILMTSHVWQIHPPRPNSCCIVW